MANKSIGAVISLSAALSSGYAAAQDIGQMPDTVKSFQSERFRKHTTNGKNPAFEAFDWESDETQIDTVTSMFPTEFNNSGRVLGSLAINGISLPPIHLQNRGSRAVTIGIADAAGNLCKKLKISPGGAERLNLCGNTLKWHDSKQMVSVQIVSGTTYEVYWGDDRWLVRDVSQDKQ